MSKVNWFKIGYSTARLENHIKEEFLSSTGSKGPSALEALEILKSIKCQMENEEMDLTEVCALWNKAYDLFTQGTRNLIEEDKHISK